MIPFGIGVLFDPFQRVFIAESVFPQDSRQCFLSVVRGKFRDVKWIRPHMLFISWEDPD